MAPAIFSRSQTVGMLTCACLRTPKVSSAPHFCVFVNGVMHQCHEFPSLRPKPSQTKPVLIQLTTPVDSILFGVPDLFLSIYKSQIKNIAMSSPFPSASEICSTWIDETFGRPGTDVSILFLQQLGRPRIDETKKMPCVVVTVSDNDDRNGILQHGFTFQTTIAGRWIFT